MEWLRHKGYTDVLTVRSREYDLRQSQDVDYMYANINPDVVIHLAATVGGIAENKARPGEFFFDNALMGILMMDYARLYGVKKFVMIGTVCSYPTGTPVPFNEDNIWKGYPYEVTGPYGMAKRLLIPMSYAYSTQYDFNSINLILVNLYGPGDNFDPHSSHVVPAIIRKCIKAKKEGKEFIQCWGDGNQTREFLYVVDAAEAIVQAMENYNSPDPVNIGSGIETSIRELTDIISAQVGYTGQRVWDTTKPSGQTRRCLDVSRARDEFGFQASTPLRIGLARTIGWAYEKGIE
jgi:nucleoside-diphosphate-sugar epimerase